MNDVEPTNGAERAAWLQARQAKNDAELAARLAQRGANPNRPLNVGGEPPPPPSEVIFAYFAAKDTELTQKTENGDTSC